MHNFFDIFINYGTLIAYIAFSADLIIQILKVVSRKSSKDISWKGTLIRLTGSSVILIKFIGLQDVYLILGQILFTLTVATYLLVIIKYKNN